LVEVEEQLAGKRAVEVVEADSDSLGGEERSTVPVLGPRTDAGSEIGTFQRGIEAVLDSQ
jgi:hypothetical protein